MSRRPLLLLVLAMCIGLPAGAEEPAAAENRLRARVAKHPGDTAARFELARTLSREKRFKAAAAEYAQLVKEHPDNPDYLLGLAQVMLWSGKPLKALPRLKRARSLAPGYADVWHAEIQARLALGDDARARVMRDTARRRFPAANWTFARLDGPVNTPLPASAEPAAPPLTASPSVPAPLPEASAPLAVPAMATAPALAPLPAARGTAVEVGVSHEHLTRGLPAWRSRYLLGEHRTAGDTIFYGGLRAIERHSLTDREAHGGIGVPVSPTLRVQAEAGISDTHRILAARYGAVQFEAQPATGWTLAGGWRRSSYDAGMTSLLHVGGDRYVGQERFSYTVFSGGPDGTGRAPSHRLQWAHYYGDRDWAGIAINAGRETENTGVAGFVTSRVHGLTVAGRHGLGGEWSLSWEAGRLRQGDAYTRSGARLGLRYAF